MTYKHMACIGLCNVTDGRQEGKDGDEPSLPLSRNQDVATMRFEAGWICMGVRDAGFSGLVGRLI